MLKLLSLVLLLVPAGIIRRADIPDSSYTRLGERFPAVIAAGRVGDATLGSWE